MTLPLDRQSGAGMLFVYGTLRRGFNHPMARMLAFRARYLGQGRLNGRLYHLGNYPGLILPRRPDEWVTGDLYDPKGAPGLLDRIDRYEGLGNRRKRLAEYQRVMATIQRDDGSTCQAWVYLYCLPVSRFRRLISGDFDRQRRRPPERYPDNIVV